MSRTYNAPTPVGAVVVFEVAPKWSREPVSLKNGNAVAIGQVLARIGGASATSAAKTGGNTGTGTLTLDATTPVLSGVKTGVYTVRFTSATAYNVEDPDGFVIGSGVNGTAFADDLKFVTAAGGTAFIAGDGFDIAVWAAADTFVPLSLTGVDGSQIPAGVAIEDKESSTSDQKLVAVLRGAVVDSSKLIWPAGATAGQIANGIATLKNLGIVSRSST